ncbi:1-phosphatidylinositol 4,5-bisphosphate phosphodiesterase delta-4 [Pelomyxa schiedti]|nr:1-phosphatidylinositol 4,5-bisphosphate phosphodiesterase delta-4 [Pelomyxa schiedti]
MSTRRTSRLCSSGPVSSPATTPTTTSSSSHSPPSPPPSSSSSSSTTSSFGSSGSSKGTRTGTSPPPRAVMSSLPSSSFTTTSSSSSSATTSTASTTASSSSCTSSSSSSSSSSSNSGTTNVGVVEGGSGAKASSGLATATAVLTTSGDDIITRGRKGSVAALLRRSNSKPSSLSAPSLMTDMTLQMRWRRKMVPVMGEVKVDSNNRRCIIITPPTTPESDQKHRFFRFPGSNSGVHLWGSVTFYGTMISECHKGQVTHTFMRCKMAAEASIAKSFSIVTREGAIHDFIASSSELRDKWVEAFEYIRVNTFQVDNFYKELLQTAWCSLTSNQDDALVTRQQVKELLKTLDVKVTKALLKTLYDDMAANKPGLDFTKFNILLYELLRRDEIVNLFEQICPGESLSEISLVSFLRDHQNEKGSSISDAREIIGAYGDEGSLQLDGFEQYLISSENSIFAPLQHKLNQDMSAPLSQYFINSSARHSSLESYSSALSKGCVKFFQVCLVEGKDKQPMTQCCLFEHFVTLLQDHAFKTTQWPVIIYICLRGATEEQQAGAATILQEKLGHLLAKRPTKLLVLPSPMSLQRKIILLGHPQDTHPDLQNLFYLHGHYLPNMPENMKAWDVLVLKEKQLGRIEWAGLAHRNFTGLTAILPSKSITDSDPISWWSHGTQIVPFFPNKNTPEHWANDGFFTQNGSSGYVRKPWFMTKDPCVFENTIPSTANSNVYTYVHIKISSARGLSKISEPLEITLEVKILGPDATRSQRFKPQKGGTFNPQWDQVFEAPLENSSLDVLVFSLGVRNITGSIAQIAHYALPVNCMQTGYRVIQMVGHDDDQPTMSTLFVWVELTSKTDIIFPLYQHISSLPEIPIAHAPKSAIIGNFDSSISGLQCLLPSFCANVISTYPPSTTPGKQVGDPICDQYSVSLATDKIIFALADGCNWGDKPKNAASNAVNNFVEFSKTYCRNVKTVKELGKMLLRALAHANRSIFGSHFQDNTTEAIGSTTILAGIVFRAEEISAPVVCLDEVSQVASSCTVNLGHALSNTFLPSPKVLHTSAPRLGSLRASGVISSPAKVIVKKKSEKIPFKWMCMLVSVGDCKVFHWSKRLARILPDFTLKNRGDSVRDPGGRIGMHTADGSPDLRNLTILCHEVEEGDVFLMCSDGVHDNLDAKNLGKHPQDLSPTMNGLSWDDAATKFPALLQDLKEQFISDRLTSIINEHCGGIDDPKQVVNGVLKYCRDTTEPIRNWLLNNPNARQPDSSADFPGKVDHTSLLYIRVGKVTEETQQQSP